MSDTVDAAAVLEAEHLARSLARISVSVPAGAGGVCDECGEAMPRLVGGRCVFCIDGREPPPGFFDRPAPVASPSAPQEETSMPNAPAVTSRKIMIEGDAALAIDARAARLDLTLKEAANELIIAGAGIGADETEAVDVTVAEAVITTIDQFSSDELIDELKARIGAATYAADVVSDYAALQSQHELMTILGAKSQDGTTIFLNVDDVYASPTKTLGQTIADLVASLGDQSAEITDIKSVLVDEDGTVATALLRVETTTAGRKVLAGYRITADGTVGRIAFVADEFEIVDPNNGRPFTPFAIVDGIVKMPNVEVDTLKAKTVTTETIVGGSVTDLSSVMFADKQITQAVTEVASMTNVAIGDQNDGKALLSISMIQDATSNADTSIRFRTYIDVGGGEVLVDDHVQGIRIVSGSAYWIMPLGYTVEAMGASIVSFRITAQSVDLKGNALNNSSYVRNLKIIILKGYR